MQESNTRKVLNDPVYGFISIPDRTIFDLIEHPYFQRLRRISQMGLSHLVYPGAHHHRFHHALGATHLMTAAMDNLPVKGHHISAEERLGATAAILLHDMGHGPYSHALEYDLVGVSHEAISLLFMERLNEELDGALDLCISIFKKEYPRRFLSQLVSSQLDVDRLDYLKRDSFYSGVSEGVVGSQRIIKMLDLHEDELVVEEKGVYSIEDFLVARRLMYWQVYLHKTGVAAEHLLTSIIRRAKHLRQKGVTLFASPVLDFFLSENVDLERFMDDPTVLDRYARLDDHDVMGAIKVWTTHEDKVLSMLSSMLVNRELPKIKISKTPPSSEQLSKWRGKVMERFDLDREEVDYFVMSDKISNHAYDTEDEMIRIKFKDGTLMDVTEASDNFNLSALAEPVEKYFLLVPRLG